MKNIKKWITPVLALIAALAVGLFSGVFLGQASAASSASRDSGFTPPTGGGNFGGGTAGTVASIDCDVVTLTLDDGSTVTITTTSDTTVTSTVDAAVSDLVAGDTISVVGATDVNGNVTSATSITEGATLGGLGGGTPRASTDTAE